MIHTCLRGVVQGCNRPLDPGKLEAAISQWGH